MKKPLASRIAILAVVYCAVFILLVIIQFSNKGAFSLSLGNMTIHGRYADKDIGSEENESLVLSDISEDEVSKDENTPKPITGGIRIYFGGLEFTLNEVRGKGLTIIENDAEIPVNPETILIKNMTQPVSGAEVHLGLPGGSVLVFSTQISEKGQELLITASFSDNVSEIAIPITPRRSSIVRDEDRLGISYSGSRFFFGYNGNELEDRLIVLSSNNSVVSYRSRVQTGVFDPSNFILTGIDNFESSILNWRELTYSKWNQLPSSLQQESEIIGYLTEAIGRRNFSTAVNSISREFTSSSRHSFRSSVFTGGMNQGYRTFTASETYMSNLISSLIKEKSLSILKEEHIIDYLFIRSETSMAYDIIDIIHNMSPDMITLDLCSGLFETASDLKKWRPAANNPIEPLIEQMLLVIQDSLIYDSARDAVLVSNSENNIDIYFSLRLGKALAEWGELNQETNWQKIGLSLILSAISNADTSQTGDMYKLINTEANYPKSVWLMDNGIWAWTAASQARASYIDGNINIAFTFPQGSSHYVIIKGIRPFIKLQIHGMDWRTDSQFERYDSSGWTYYPQDQILILKLRQRENIENVRIFYRVPPPPPVPVVTADENTEESLIETDE